VENRVASVSLRPACRAAVGPTSQVAAAVEDSRTERVMASYRRLPSLAVNPDTSSRFAASTDDPDSFTNGASPLNGGRASITDK
jgi:hypothetical protein